MDNQRLLVWATFGMMLWLTYQAWMQDYASAPVPTEAQTNENGAAPAADDGSLPDLPAGADDAPQFQDDARLLDDGSGDQPEDRANIVRVVNDVLALEISTQGATVRRATVRKYPVAKDRPDDLVELLSPTPPHTAIIQTGLRAAGDSAEPNHLVTFSTTATDYAMNANDEIVVPMSWSDGQGITVEKEIRLTRGSYRIDITQRIRNDSGRDWRGAEYAQLLRHSEEAERSMFNVDSYSFDGPIVYDGEKSAKLDRDDLLSDGPMNVIAKRGWTGGIQHHFLTVIIPPAEEEYRYSTAARANLSTSSTIGPAVIVANGAEHTFATTLFVGPKLQAQLEDITESLKLTVDYGWLTIISQPLFWLLSKVYKFVGNWGLAIILVTVLIKAVFYKLTEASGRSMAKMREIQPRMKALQDRYKDDRQALSQAMMELYKREKVNPAAGCLPILIQMPFFLAFYWVLLESVEMRQAPFALWITDLSSRDPYFILPIIMGAAMLFQQKLNPAPADPVQAKVMQVMPIVFTGFFAFFPSGLVLYWVTNTLLSIAQQWYINKIVHEEATARKGSKKSKENAT
jgi:YidC/Oxa1 family membrane protein insertase